MVNNFSYTEEHNSGLILEELKQIKELLQDWKKEWERQRDGWTINEM